MNWWKRFKAGACSIKLKAGTKDEALAEIVEGMIKAGVLDEGNGPVAIKALLDREVLASTGVGMNVAIPHVKLPALAASVCSLAISHSGLDWAAVDGAPVHIFFTVLRPAEATDDHDPEEHLDMMRWIAKLAREPDFRAFAFQAKTKTDLVNLLKEMSAV